MDEIAINHHVVWAWDQTTRKIRQEMQHRRLHPSDVVVVVPYAQLMRQARNAWLRSHDSAGLPSLQAPTLFLPYFQTSMNWSRSLAGFVPAPQDIHMDAARDVLTAASLLSRAGLADQAGLLAGRLMQAAWSLARLASAVPPEERLTWGHETGLTLSVGMDAPMVALETAIARIALAWAASSSYATDAVLKARPGLLVVLEGFQSEPITRQLLKQRPDHVMVLPLDMSQVADLTPTPEDRVSLIRPTESAGSPISPSSSFSTSSSTALYMARDVSDESQMAAACVLNHLRAGRTPVALVAQDRFVTRQVHALLTQQGVTVLDETGWKLSTTRSAAFVMNLLRACAWNASMDTVLDFIKNAPAFDSATVRALEVSARRLGQRDWNVITGHEVIQDQVQALRDSLKADRKLKAWIADLRLALGAAGLWSVLSQDPAGQQVLDTLRLHPGDELEFEDVALRMSQGDFASWVNQALEGQRFSSKADATVQVIILPLSQLLGRSLAAVVMPGCDEVRLVTSPEPVGIWTPQQRTLLGLPGREELTLAQERAWNYLLKFAHVDIVWRSSEGGEALAASGFVQRLQSQQQLALSPDPRSPRALVARPCAKPLPQGHALPLKTLSSTAYEDLRRCPYRFFALRQLKLQVSDELETQTDKRDFGNWLHAVLKAFHDQLIKAPSRDAGQRLTMINAAAHQATLALGLSGADFLPFASTWPRVRAGYLHWLAEHERSGATFVEAETWKQTPLGPISLVGKIDRIDRLPDGSPWVMDYKTESRVVTAQRIKPENEDTQLAFYAALLPDDTVSAAYVSVTEDRTTKDASKSYPQVDVTALRDQLLAGIQSDMAQIASGAVMPALGEGKSCEFCAARGLCRKDFWSEP